MTVTRLHYQLTAENHLEREIYTAPSNTIAMGQIFISIIRDSPRHYNSANALYAILYHQHYTILPNDTVIKYHT